VLPAGSTTAASGPRLKTGAYNLDEEAVFE
jgi:hypothetical protein